MHIFAWHALTDLAVPQPLNKDFRQILGLRADQIGLSLLTAEEYRKRIAIFIGLIATEY